MEKQKKQITITQIAKECNVSISTVSRVLNGADCVAADKKERIEAAIKKYDFTPNAMARGLLSKNSMSIGVILPDISNPYFSSLFLEIERYALESGYSIILCNTLYGHSSHGISNLKDEDYYFQMMIDKQVDGVLIIGGQIDMTEVTLEYKTSLKKLASKLPVVVVGQQLEGIDCTFIEAENDIGILSALNYLHMLGHNHIAFVGGQSNVTITAQRLAAYQKGLELQQLPYVEELVSLSDYYIRDGYEAMNQLLGRDVDFTAFLAVNDNVALGAIRALSDQGLTVPEDKAVISCDQFFSGEYLIPRLSSINQHHDMLGRLVISTLIHIIKGDAKPLKFAYVPELVIRESCGLWLETESEHL